MVMMVMVIMMVMVAMMMISRDVDDNSLDNFGNYEGR